MNFPDCRMDEDYNEDFLNSRDQTLVSGFDLAVENAENFFNNFHVEEVIGEMADNDYVKKITDVFLEGVKTHLLEWLECERDRMIVSLLEGMDDAEYEALKAKAKEAHPDKEYCDTRSFFYLS